jgi:hypothetical protein
MKNLLSMKEGTLHWNPSFVAMPCILVINALNVCSAIAVTRGCRKTLKKKFRIARY